MAPNYGVQGNRGLVPLGGPQSLGMGAQGGMPDIDPATINALLQHFGGMSIPDQPAPQGPFETGWMGQHLGGLGPHLDNALIALGNMGPTGRTAGENISNAARGIMSIGPTRNAQAMAQYQVPLQMAGEVAKLQLAQHQMNREDSMAGWYDQRADNTLEKARIDAASRGNVADIRANASVENRRLAMTKGPMLMKGDDGKPVVGFPDIDDDTGQLIYRPNKDIDPDAFAKQQTKGHVMGMFGNSLEGQMIQHTVGMPPDMSDPDSPKNGPYWKNAMGVYKGLQMQKTVYSAGAASGRQDTGDWNKTSDEQFKAFLGEHGKNAEDRLKTRRMQLQEDPKNANANYSDIRQQAQSEEDARTQRVQAAYGQYKMLPEDAPPGTPSQRSVQGPVGYFNSLGYDPKTRDFTNKPQQPQGNAMGAGLPAAQGQTQQTAPAAPMTPQKSALENFMGAFKKSPTP